MPVEPGTAPQVGGTATPEPQVGEQPAGDPQVGEAPQSALTLEQALDALRKARAEAADHRTARRALEAKQQEVDRAQLSKEEQLALKISDLERTLSEREQTYQEARVMAAVERAATKMGIVDSDAAYKLLDLDQLETDDSGNPKNMDALLRALVAKRPYLQGSPPVSPTNPNLNHSRGTGIRASQLSDIDYWEKNKAAIHEAMRNGTLIKD